MDKAEDYVSNKSKWVIIWSYVCAGLLLCGVTGACIIYMCLDDEEEKDLYHA